MNNLNMQDLLKMLATMDKTQIEEGIAKANQILKSNGQENINKENILKNLNKNI